MRWVVVVLVIYANSDGTFDTVEAKYVLPAGSTRGQCEAKATEVIRLARQSGRRVIAAAGTCSHVKQ